MVLSWTLTLASILTCGQESLYIAWVNTMAKNWLKYSILIALTVLLAWIAASRVAAAQDYMLNGDFFTFWLGGHMISQGQNPYDANQWLVHHDSFGAKWIPNNAYIYPLPLAIVTSPLGLLALPIASKVWVFLSILMVLMSVGLSFSFGLIPRKLFYLLPAICGVLTFRPVLVTLRNGQFGALWLLCLASTIWLWRRNQWFIGGLFLPIIMLKPSFGIILVGLVAIWLLIIKRWTALAGMSVSGAILMVLGWLYNPTWIPSFLEAGQNKLISNFGFSPNIWGFLFAISRQNLATTIFLGTGLCILLFITFILFLINRHEHKSPEYLISLIITIALLMTPYLWAYDQILLIIPILVTMSNLYRMDKPYLLVATSPILMTIISLLLLILAVKFGNDASSVLLTVVSLVMVVMTTESDRIFLRVKSN